MIYSLGQKMSNLSVFPLTLQKYMFTNLPSFFFYYIHIFFPVCGIAS